MNKIMLRIVIGNRQRSQFLTIFLKGQFVVLTYIEDSNRRNVSSQFILISIKSCITVKLISFDRVSCLGSFQLSDECPVNFTRFLKVQFIIYTYTEVSNCQNSSSQSILIPIRSCLTYKLISFDTVSSLGPFLLSEECPFILTMFPYGQFVDLT